MGKIISYLFTVAVLAGLSFAAYTFLNDLKGPEISISPDTGRISPNQDIEIQLKDATSNIKSVSVYLRKNNQATTVFEHIFTTKAATQSIKFNLKNSGLRDGQFELEIKAKDSAFAGFGQGNSTTKTWDMRLDTQPPVIRVRSTAPNLRKGSITAIAYTASEELSHTGIMLNNSFFPAFLQSNGVYYCFLVFPLDLTVDQFKPEIVASDLAGNNARSKVFVHAQDRVYRSDNLTINDRFLDAKSDIFEKLIPEPGTNLERYVRINNEVRISNEQTLLEVGKKTAPTMLWQGEFIRLPRSAVKANFGDNRTYLYNKTKIDYQTHMGLDLASVVHAEIPAANQGIVVFAEPLGIFGNLVIIDHGLGLQSLYSHMSQIIVQVGDQVKKGQTIGNTGVTGLAGGDHLHFGILMHGIQAQPIDWLDKNWIKNTITDRLAAVTNK